MLYYKSPEELIIVAASTCYKPAVLKAQLIEIAKEHGCEVKDKADKRDVALLIADKLGYAKLQELVHTGVSSQEFQAKFDISHDDVKKMERKGFLTVTGYYEARMYGKYRNVPLYDAFQFFGLTKPEVDAWLTENRPKRKAQTNE